MLNKKELNLVMKGLTDIESNWSKNMRLVYGERKKPDTKAEKYTDGESFGRK